MPFFVVGCNFYEEKRCVFYAKYNFSPAENEMETFCNMNFRNENLIHLVIYLNKMLYEKRKPCICIVNIVVFKMFVKIIP